MNESKSTFWQDCGVTPRDRINQRRVILWSFAWIAPWVALTLALKKELLPFNALSMIALGVITLFGVRMLFAYRKFLVEADELRRKIELEALAASVGISLVSGFTYATLEDAGVVEPTDILSMVMVMIAAYMVTLIINLWRYSYR